MTSSAPRARLRASALVAALVAASVGACGSNRAAVDDPGLRSAEATTTLAVSATEADASAASQVPAVIAVSTEWV